MLLRAVVFGCIIWTGVTSPTACAQAAHADSVAATILIDSSTVEVRQFDEASLDRFRNHPDFQYEEQQLDLSWWQRFKRWVRHQLIDLFSRDGSWELLKNVLIVLGVIALVYLIVKLLGMDPTGIFLRKARTAEIPFAEHTENIHAIDFESELQKAITVGNYRLAVRLLYLDCLKRLSDSKYIDWQPAKTNTAYIGELTDTDTRTAFRGLTRQFEYVWYGDFRINEQHFTRLHTAFKQFGERLT